MSLAPAPQLTPCFHGRSAVARAKRKRLDESARRWGRPAPPHANVSVLTRSAKIRLGQLLVGLAMVLCLESAGAQSAPSDPSIVERPEWKVGDWWELRDGDSAARRVTVIGKEQDQYVLVSTVVGVPGMDAPGATKLYAESDGWIVKTLFADGQTRVSGDKREWIQFPASVGKRWFFTIQSSTTQGGRGHFVFDCKAEGWETIHVANRNVRALKIGCQSRNRDTGKTNTHAVWYAPEAKRIVRVVSHYVGGPTVEALAWGARSAADTLVATPLSPPLPKVADRWAVVIGIGEYEHRQIPPLRFAVRDAEAMYEFLTTKGGYQKDHVLLLTDTTQTKPTLAGIKRALGDFLVRRSGREDMVLIYFAGHGAPEVDVAGIEADGLSKYLVPRDGDPDSLYTTALPMEEIQRIFMRIPSERVVMLLDTCYSGSAGGRTFARQQTRATGLNDQFLERLTRSRGRVIITASAPNEVALEMSTLGHGLFTYYVLQGLSGKADRNGDGLVTVSELYEYVEEEVDRKAREAGGRQRPLMKGEVEGTLPLAKVGGR